MHNLDKINLIGLEALEYVLGNDSDILRVSDAVKRIGQYICSNESILDDFYAYINENKIELDDFSHSFIVNSVMTNTRTFFK